MTPAFIWNKKNVEHIAEHGVTPEEAEFVVLNGRTTYHEDNKWLARGQTRSGRYLQVIYVMESDATGIDYSEVDLLEVAGACDSFYVIHARPLTTAERSTFKRRKRKGKR
jgi:uncharacterized DUF497 family protein